MPQIEILPTRLANQIAAGEVVERPASVVKELVENSLDAGATRIHIDIERGGHKLIRIRDNGKGIDKDELGLALSRHATSKLKTLDDLEQIGSLGFRGEALASISSVSRLTLSSKPKAQAEAWQAYAEGRDMAVKIQPCAHPDGTTIEVLDLFFNTPARRKFLRTEKTEFTHIDELIKRIALSRFDVAITLTHNHKVVRQYRPERGESTGIKRIAQVAGKAFLTDAYHIEVGDEALKLWGYALAPGQATEPQYTYVNGRMMRDKLILHAIRQAFDECFPSQPVPAFVVYLDIDVRQVDVNVHPAKHEVRFHQARLVHDFIVRAIKDMAAHMTLAPDSAQHVNAAAHTAPEPSFAGALTEQSLQNEAPVSHSTATKTDPFYTPRATKNQGLESTGFGQRQQPSYQQNQASHAFYQGISELSASHFDLAVEDKPAEAQMQHFMVLNKGVVAFNQDGELYHASASALMPDVVAAQMKASGQIAARPLLLPIRVKLTADEAEPLNKLTSMLETLGCHITVNERFMLLKQVPSFLYHMDANALANAMINHANEADTQLESWLPWLANQANAALTSAKHDSHLCQAIADFIQQQPESINKLLQKAVKIEL